jgi:hypothetical protein
MTCSLCNKEILGDSHNAHPIGNEECCSECNSSSVIPLRLFLSGIYQDKALVLNTDNSISLIKPMDKTFILNELQEQVKGYIEVYPLRIPGYVVLVNEEGLIHNMEFNQLASRVFGMKAVGPVMICPEAIFE